MSNNAFCQLIEQTLQRPLTSLEQAVIQGAWQGERYRRIADDSGYVEEYVKQVGAKLWGELSAKVGSTVTKKNLRLIFQSSDGSPGAGSRMVAWEDGGIGEGRPTVLPDLSLLGLEFPSAPLPLGSPLYIPRPPTEEICFGEISRPGALLCIKAPRRFGKTSLLQRVIAYASTQGDRACRIDLQEADNGVFQSIDALLRWFCCRIAHTLNLDLRPDQGWDPDLGSKVNAGLFMQQLLTQGQTPLLLAINALERVFFFESVAQDFLSMLRFWHERSKHSDPWQHLRMVLVYSTESYVTLNFDQSPFNVGYSTRLQPFTLLQFLELGRRYRLPYIDDSHHRFTLEALFRLIAGHPYLANLSFYSLARSGQTVANLLKQATSQESIFHSHLQEIWGYLRQNAAVQGAWQRVVDSQGQGCRLNAIDTLRLESIGLIRVQDDLVYSLCNLYEDFFATQLHSTP